MRILDKLNGWQRLWLLSAAIWVVPVVIFTYTTAPETFTPSEMLKDQRYTNADSATRAATFLKYIVSDPNYASANEATKAAIRQRFGIAESQLITTEARAIDIQSKSPLKTIVFGVLAWVLPVVMIYFIGFAFRWVYVGFNRN